MYRYTIDTVPTIDVRANIGHRARRMEFRVRSKVENFITKQVIANVSVNVKDLTVIRNQQDAKSVDLFVWELQQEPYDKILLYKCQHEIDPAYPSLPWEPFLQKTMQFWKEI